jgi:hypothetical protein
MTTDRFKAALAKGIAESEEADANRREAESAIRSFGEAIQMATKGTIAVYLDATSTEKGRYLSDMVAKTLGAPEIKRTQTHAIFAQVKVGATTGSTERLCIVTFAPRTYPVEIQWVNDTRICSTRDSLLDALEALTSDPDTGKKFRRLLDEGDKLVHRQKVLDDGGEIPKSASSGEAPSDDSEGGKS